MMDRAQKKKLYLTSLMVSVVATAIGSGAMGVMLSSIIDAYDLQTAQEGYMSSCISAGALAALLGGILLRGRVSKPAFIFWGGTLMSVMLLLKGTAIPFGVFLAVCTAMGLGMGVMDSFQSAFLADLIPERSAQGLGVLHGIFGVGGFALPLALHRLLAGHGWRQVYVMIGLVCLALMLQFGLASRKMAHDRLFAVKLETSGNFSQIRNFIKQPVFLCVAAVYLSWRSGAKRSLGLDSALCQRNAEKRGAGAAVSVPVLDREHCQPRDDTKTSSSAERCTCSGFRADSGSLDSWHCVGKRCDDAHLLHHRRTWKRLLHSGAAERGRGVQPGEHRAYNKYSDDRKNDRADLDAACRIGNTRVDRRNGGHALDRCGFSGRRRRSGRTDLCEEKRQIALSYKGQNDSGKTSK